MGLYFTFGVMVKMTRGTSLNRLTSFVKPTHIHTSMLVRSGLIRWICDLEMKFSAIRIFFWVFVVTSSMVPLLSLLVISWHLYVVAISRVNDPYVFKCRWDAVHKWMFAIRVNLLETGVD